MNKFSILSLCRTQWAPAFAGVTVLYFFILKNGARFPSGKRGAGETGGVSAICVRVANALMTWIPRSSRGMTKVFKIFILKCRSLIL